MKSLFQSLCLTICVAAACAATALAEPVGTAFTYQGRLDQSDVPVDGSYDFEVRLFDGADPPASNPVGSPEVVEDVVVGQGLFSLDLDFGDVFTADPVLWLEIGVREGSETRAFTVLAPRQRVSPAPLALHAGKADLLGTLAADDVVRSAGDSMTGPLEIRDSSVTWVDGAHAGGQAFSEPLGLTLATPSTDRLHIDTHAVGVGVDQPVEKLDVDGAIRLGLTAAQNAGTIRWTGTDFEGFDGIEWQSLTVGADGGFVDLTSNQTIGGQKTLSQFMVAEGGLLSLDTIRVGTTTEGESIDIYTGSTGINLYKVGGSRFGELRTNSDNDFVLQANGGKLRTQSHLYLQNAEGGTFRDLYAGDVRIHDGLLFRDDSGDTKGQFNLSGDNVAFFPSSSATNLEVRGSLQISSNSADEYLRLGTASSPRIFFERGASSSRDLTMRMGPGNDGRLRVLGSGSYSLGLNVGGTVDVDDDVEVGRNLVFSNVPTGANDGQLCFDETIVGDFVIRCSSSRRYKDQIADLSPGLDLVERLRPVTFRWKKDGTEDLGFVAEEVAEQHPLLATYAEGRVDGVKYDRLTAVLVNAVQEQQAQIRALRALVCADHEGAAVCSSGSAVSPGTSVSSAD